MAEAFLSAEFLASDGPERAKQCRQLASEAAGLAVDARTPEMRQGYLDLQRQWTKLAEEIEREEALKKIPIAVLQESSALKPG